MIFKRIGLIGLVLAQMIILGHDLIPHDHDHKHDHDYHHDHGYTSQNSDNFSLVNHSHPTDDGKNENKEGGPHLLNIFCYVHHLDGEIIYLLTLPSGDQQNGSFDYNFAGITENCFFENTTVSNHNKEPLRQLHYCNLQPFYTYGLRAPPASIA